MPLTREQIASRIREVREASGFTQAAVAEVLEVHRPAVSEIEAGRRAVSTEELYRLAQLFAMPISALLAESPPTSDEVFSVLFRREGAETAVEQSAVRRFMQRCEAEQELEAILGIPHDHHPRRGYTVAYPSSKGEAIRQGEAIALEERRALGLGDQPIRNPLTLLEQHGVRVGPIDSIGSSAIDGLYFESANLGACIGVATRESDVGNGRAAFTAAHEWAHWLLQDLQVEFYRHAQISELHEVRANAFAAAFLMPLSGIRRYFSDAGLLASTNIMPHLSPGDVVRAMDHFGVSRSALLWRLQNLEMISPSTFAALKDFSVQRTAAALELQFASRGFTGSRLPQLAIHAWRLGHLSTGRAADLCEKDLADFKELAAQLGETQDSFDDAGMISASAAR